MAVKKDNIEKLDFKPGDVFADSYRIEAKLGTGWEGEVYLIREINSGIERAAKFFFPHRNPANRTVRRIAQKLHKLRDCKILIGYHHQEQVLYKNKKIACLISEFVDGEILSGFIQRQPKKKLELFEALSLFYELIVGVEQIHKLKEYHGDLHAENVMVRRSGLKFHVKLIDLYYHADSKVANMQFDILNLMKIFVSLVGGREKYNELPSSIRYMLGNLRESIISARFRNLSRVRQYLEELEWD